MGVFEQSSLTEEYKEILKEISIILFKHDPIGINFTNNSEEYTPEAKTILIRLENEESLTLLKTLDIVHEEFLVWFNFKGLVGDRATYAEVAAEIYHAWKRFKSDK